MARQGPAVAPPCACSAGLHRRPWRREVAPPDRLHAPRSVWLFGWGLRLAAAPRAPAGLARPCRARQPRLAPASRWAVRRQGRPRRRRTGRRAPVGPPPHPLSLFFFFLLFLPAASLGSLRPTLFRSVWLQCVHRPVHIPVVPTHTMRHQRQPPRRRRRQRSLSFALRNAGHLQSADSRPRVLTRPDAARAPTMLMNACLASHRQPPPPCGRSGGGRYAEQPLAACTRVHSTPCRRHVPCTARGL